MTFPNKKVLKKIRENLNHAEPSYLLPEDANQTDKLKYALCQKFVVYILKHKISQANWQDNLIWIRQGLMK